MDLAFVAAVDLVVQGFRLDLPADHDGHEQGAERHRNAFGPGVHEVEPAVIPRSGLRADAEELPRGERTRAKTVGSDEAGQQEDDDAHEGDRTRTAGLLTARAGAVDKRDGDRLDQGDGGRDGRDQNEGIEDEAEDAADGAHVMEHVLQGGEQKGRAAELDLGDGHALGDAVGDGRRDNGETGHDGNEGIGDNDDNGVFRQVLTLTEVGAIGDHGAHRQRQGEEHLTTGRRQNGHDAGCLVDEAALDRVAGDEHELQTFRSVRERPGTDDDDDEHDEQSGHADLVELLNAAADTVEVDEVADDHEAERHENAHAGVGEQRVKALSAGHTLEQADNVDDDVVDAVAAEDRVEGHDQERGDDGKPADPLELLRQSLVGVDRAEAGLTTHRQLGEHDREADEDREGQVNDQEGEAAALAHFVREAPDIAEADGGTDGRQQKADIAAK